MAIFILSQKVVLRQTAVVTHLMKTQETLTNEELIDYVYYDIAGKYLNEKMTKLIFQNLQSHY